MEKETKELIKKSFTKIPSKDFTERVMNSIREEAKVEKRAFTSRALAWIMVILSAVLIPFGIWNLTANFQKIQLHYITLSPDPDELMITLSVIFAGLLLFLIDRLLKISKPEAGSW